MKASLLDTDTLSYLLDRRYTEVNETARQYLRVYRRLSVSSITVAEMVKGITRRPGHVEQLATFLKEAEQFEVFPLYLEESILAGRMLGALLQAGQPVGALDPFIAATAIENGLTLVTNNTKHYERVIDLGFPLELGNWRKPL